MTRRARLALSAYVTLNDGVSAGAAYAAGQSHVGLTSEAAQITLMGAAGTTALPQDGRPARRKGMSVMNYQTVILDKTDGVARITLNRPHVLNAISAGLLNDLKTALGEADDDDSIGVVVITGAGRAFSAGVDIKTRDPETGQAVSPSRELALEVIDTIENLAKPVIAAVNGHCLTGALELATACDIIVASERAVFGDTHGRWGLTPTWGGSQRLPRLIGALKAKELFFTGDILSAAEAERIGLVNRVVPDETLVEAVSEMTARILTNSRETIRIEKSLVNRGLKMDYAEGLALERQESPGNTVGSAERMRSFTDR